MLISLKQCASLARSNFLQPKCFALANQVRNTFILKRHFPLQLSKLSYERPRKLKGRHYVYDLVEDTTNKKPEPVSLVLTRYVEGLGEKGDIVSVKPHLARTNLLPSGKAVYASPENIEAYAEFKKEEKPEYSSPYALYIIKFLSETPISITMNEETPWTLEPWHVRVAFRRTGVIVPEDVIELPSQAIKGPDLANEGNEFAVHVTLNNTERIPVRFKLFHCNRDPETVFPSDPEWFYAKSDPILQEQAELLASMPRRKPHAAQEGGGEEQHTESFIKVTL